MEKELTPQQSFELINQIIDNRRATYEENGSNILMWGLAVMIAGIGQYIMLQTSLAPKSGLIWLFTMVPLFIYTIFISAVHNKKSESSKKERADWDISGMAWFMAGTMAMLNGFIFRGYYGIGFTTVMFLPFGVAALVTALTIKKKSLVYLTLLATFVAFSGLYIPFIYHPLISALIAFLMFFLPGVFLRNDYKKRQNV